MKKFDIWTVPDVLIIHLKRFLYVPGAHFVYREKLTEMVDFPIEGLDLSDYVLGPSTKSCIYDLHGVSEHSGGMGGGHYTAVCRNPNSGKW
jgi:ubiquitin carboxyl-terminal hydrolase 4/11/15